MSTSLFIRYDFIENNYILSKRTVDKSWKLESPKHVDTGVSYIPE